MAFASIFYAQPYQGAQVRTQDCWWLKAVEFSFVLLSVSASSRTYSAANDFAQNRTQGLNARRHTPEVAAVAVACRVQALLPSTPLFLELWRTLTRHLCPHRNIPSVCYEKNKVDLAQTFVIWNIYLHLSFTQWPRFFTFLFTLAAIP